MEVSHPPTAETQVSVRSAVLADVADIVSIYNEAVQTTTATFDTEPRSVEEQRNWMAEHDARHPVLVAEYQGRIVGWIALSPWSDRRAYDRTAEISVYVRADWRGKGVGRHLMSQVLELARASGLHTILARVAEGNPASRRLHAGAGFSSVGVMHEVGHKFGRFLDVELLELRLAGLVGRSEEHPSGGAATDPRR